VIPSDYFTEIDSCWLCLYYNVSTMATDLIAGTCILDLLSNKALKTQYCRFEFCTLFFLYFIVYFGWWCGIIL
jgi:hypothetical protein